MSGCHCGTLCLRSAIVGHCGTLPCHCGTLVHTVAHCGTLWLPLWHTAMPLSGLRRSGLRRWRSGLRRWSGLRRRRRRVKDSVPHPPLVLTRHDVGEKALFAIAIFPTETASTVVLTSGPPWMRFNPVDCCPVFTPILDQGHACFALAFVPNCIPPRTRHLWTNSGTEECGFSVD